MISQPFGYLTLTTTSILPAGAKCCVCGGVAAHVIFDYSEVEFGVLIQPHDPKLVCHEHARPPKLYFLDGHAENVRDIQRKMYHDQWTHPSFELAQEDR